ncbi:BTAD domain-containing putative transcriptional regulator [Streptomyces sp. NPDC059385]|uniref:AfsR/SARP family transcriptional regulator n=1 Tax=Streptomyces sp. NPDC059385 TaxID=3346817 RepID=UPI0036C9FFC6
MDIDVLGGLDVFENGVPIAAAAPSERQVLALLAAHADMVVPVDVLAEELRALVPREQAHPVLRAAVRRLYERLDAAVAPCGDRTAGTALVRTADGYRLDTGGGSLDVREFAREADAGHLALARGEYATAADRLRSALRLWKGPAFDGVTPGPRLTDRIVELELARKTAVEGWVEAQLELDRLRRVLDGAGGAAGEAAPAFDGAGESRPVPGPGPRPLPRQFARVAEGDSGWNRMRPGRASARTAAPAAAPARGGIRLAACRMRHTHAR